MTDCRYILLIPALTHTAAGLGAGYGYCIISYWILINFIWVRTHSILSARLWTLKYLLRGQWPLKNIRLYLLIRASFFLLLASFEWKDNALFTFNSGTAGSTLHFMLDLVEGRYFESKVLFLRRYSMVILMFQQFTTKQVVIIRPAQHCADRRDNLISSREQKLVQAPTSHSVGRYNCGGANPAAWSTTGGNSRSSAVNLAKLKRYLHLDTARNSLRDAVRKW